MDFFNKTIIPLALVGYEMIIAYSALRVGYLPSHIQRALVECSIYNQSWLRAISNIPLYPKWILPIYMSITLVAASIHTLAVFTFETDYPFKTRQNWQVKTDRLFVQNKNRYVFTLRQIICLTRIIQRITRLKRMIPSLVWEPPLALIKADTL